MGDLIMAKKAKTKSIEEARTAKPRAVELFGRVANLTGYLKTLQAK